MQAKLKAVREWEAPTIVPPLNCAALPNTLGREGVGNNNTIPE